MANCRVVFMLAVVVALFAASCHATDVTGTTCPLCGMDADFDEQVAFLGGQEMYFCSEMDHGFSFVTNPSSVMASARTTAVQPGNLQVNGPGRFEPTFQCPVTGMDLQDMVDDGETLYRVSFVGNQAMYFATQAASEEFRSEPLDFTTFDVTEGTSEFCTGGSVMYNGFSNNFQERCIIFLFEEWVLDSEVKFAFGIMGAFFMGMLNEVIVYARRAVQQDVLAHRQRGLARAASSPSVVERSNPESCCATEKYEEGRQPSVPSLKQPLIQQQQQQNADMFNGWAMKLFMTSMYMIQVTNGYALMLFIMSYRYEIVLPTIFGLCAGHIAFLDIDAHVSASPEPCCQFD
jgi:YHS domain-containing protein